MDVSIIIPTYRNIERLERALKSCLNQDFELNFEIIIIDDNGDQKFTSAVCEIVKSLKDDRIALIVNQRNSNGAYSRNKGVSYSKAKYIAFLDDDDTYRPSKIRRQFEWMESNKGYAGCYVGRVDKGKIIVGKPHWDLRKQILTSRFTPTTPALMFRKIELVNTGLFNESLKRFQDLDHLLRYFALGYKLGVVDYIGVEIHLNEGINVPTGKELNEQVKLFNDFIVESTTDLEKRVVNRALTNNWVKAFLRHAVNWDLKQLLFTMNELAKINFLMVIVEFARVFLVKIRRKVEIKITK